MTRKTEPAGRAGPFLSLPISSTVLADIEKEMGRAFALHGHIPKDENRAMVVLVREVGEAAQEVAHRNPSHHGQVFSPTDDLLREQRLYDELIQVASVAVRWLMVMELDRQERNESARGKHYDG